MRPGAAGEDGASCSIRSRLKRVIDAMLEPAVEAHGIVVGRWKNLGQEHAADTVLPIGARGAGRGERGVLGPGGDLLFRTLRCSTIGAEGFHGRVRDGIGCLAPRHGHQAGKASPAGRRGCVI
jgi:hypothetical protein